MGEMKHYLGVVSLLGPSTLALVLILVVDLGLTLVHSVQELKGKLWRYFGAIEGFKILDKFGFSIFFLGLTTSL